MPVAVWLMALVATVPLAVAGPVVTCADPFDVLDAVPVLLTTAPPVRPVTESPWFTAAVLVDAFPTTVLRPVSAAALPESLTVELWRMICTAPGVACTLKFWLASVADSLPVAEGAPAVAEAAPAVAEEAPVESPAAVLLPEGAVPVGTGEGAWCGADVACAPLAPAIAMTAPPETDNSALRMARRESALCGASSVSEGREDPASCLSASTPPTSWPVSGPARKGRHRAPPTHPP
ncbi:MAG: hypothetical protein J2P16_17260 [Mycobacterium sp.]|nr:hypothetical protein [Mycobacterium sp.]